MEHRMKRSASLIALIFLTVFIAALAQDRGVKISEDEIKQFVKNPDCEGVTIYSLEYFDFGGKGNNDAVVVASTCATGTAGPDVHSVLHRQSDGSLMNLKIPEPTEKQRSALFGQVFYELKVKNGLLMATYHDESGRTDPLVIGYRWNPGNNEFQPVEVQGPQRYKASFDCDKAKTVVENAICYSSTTASLDLAVDQAYRTWLDSLNKSDSDSLIKEQQNWLRKRDVICGAERSAFQCVETLYRERLLEVEYFKQLHAAR
jgi:uncharacterized protein YecT (DUF1311 family)